MGFFDLILSFPTVVFTILLGVALVYWVISILGLTGLESGDADLDVDIEPGADVGDASPSMGTLAGSLVALGLDGVPFSVVFSLLMLFSWVISGTAAPWALSYFPNGTSHYIVGAAVLVGAFVCSLLPTVICVRPLRRLFVTHKAISNASLVGQECVILTGSVDEKFGRAEVLARGAGYHIPVVASTPNRLKRGDTALILEYDKVSGIFHIEEKDSFETQLLSTVNVEEKDSYETQLASAANERKNLS